MSARTLVFKAGGGNFGGFSVGTVMIKLTDPENLACKVLALGVRECEEKQCFWELVLFMRGMRHFPSSSSIWA